MAYMFEKRIYDPINLFLQVAKLQLSDEDSDRLTKSRIAWNFYEGYHWEEITDKDQPQVTVNYCKTFINKFIAFEFGRGFVIKMKPEIEKIDGENDPLDFLNEVWRYNKKEEKLFEIGQSKAVTGDAFVQVSYVPKTINGKLNPDFYDPFGEFGNGKMRITVVPSSICFPEYDEIDKDKLISLSIMYLIPEEEKTVLGIGKGKLVNKLYRQVWTRDFVKTYRGDTVVNSIPNKYDIIPFKHIKNLALVGKNYGMSDIDDMIPINMELNLKKSNMSEIIDYHSAPITIVYGARVANLQRGANKVWGGLPKDAKVENLKLEGELDASEKYCETLRQELMETCDIPVSSLGGDLNISNTSSIALQVTLMPLLEKIKLKHNIDTSAIAEINKMILLIALKEEILTIPTNISRKDYFYNEISFESILPKDVMVQLQEIDQERKMMLITKADALKRLGRDNIEQRIKDIDEEIENRPEFYGIVEETEDLNTNKEGKDKKINAGLLNSPTPKPNNMK